MTAPPPASPTSPFAESSRLGRFIVLSGTRAIDASGQIVGKGDVKAQTRAVLDQLKAAAGRAGVALERAATVNVYLRRASDFAAMNEVYRTVFTVDPPARTTVVTALGHPDALVEIGMVAVAAGEPREVIHPAGWVKSPNPYSYGIRSGDTLFLAGLVSRRGADNSPVPGDATVQTRAVLENAQALLAAGGMAFADVVSSRVYITQASAFGAMNDAYRTAFPAQPPARATVVTELMNPDLSVEITLVAVQDSGRRVIGQPSALPLSQAVAAGGRLFVSGMLGNTPATTGNPVAQTRLMVERIGQTLANGGLGWADVREAVLYVTDIATRDAVLTEMATAFPGRWPAGLVVETGLVAPDGLVELMVTATK